MAKAQPVVHVVVVAAPGEGGGRGVRGSIMIRTRNRPIRPHRPTSGRTVTDGTRKWLGPDAPLKILRYNDAACAGPGPGL